MSDLIALLQGLGDATHDDLSVAHDALEEIIRLRLENEELRDQIAAHEKVCAGVWVKVEERLPEDGYKYLCLVEGEKRPRYVELMVGDWVDKYLSDVVVTHWLDARLPGEEG